MDFSIRFDEEKNQLLQATRGVSFEEILRHIKDGDLLAEIKHPSPSRSNQRIYVVKIDDYAYAVPYVINQHAQEIFLKTIYPSGEFTKLYLRKGEL
jgi:hypothetical protein